MCLGATGLFVSPITVTNKGDITTTLKDLVIQCVRFKKNII